MPQITFEVTQLDQADALIVAHQIMRGDADFKMAMMTILLLLKNIDGDTESEPIKKATQLMVDALGEMEMAWFTEAAASAKT